VRHEAMGYTKTRGVPPSSGLAEGDAVNSEVGL